MVSKSGKLTTRETLPRAFKKPHLKSLSQRGGVKRRQDDVFDKSREVADKWLTEVLSDALISMDFTGRKKLQVEDIVFGLNRKGITPYGTSNVPTKAKK